MAVILPLRGIRYNTDKIKDLATVIAPPYDVVSAEEQARLHAQSDFNIIRLELGQDLAGDDDTNNRYSRARAQLDHWLNKGVLKVEQAPSLYVHLHEFTFRGAHLSRLALIARLRLDDWNTGAVLPHENTLSKPKADRMKLLRASECNLSPIMILYEDSEIRQRLTAEIAARPADANATEPDGQKHSLWVISDNELITSVTSRLATKPTFIADGHHRYETALQYRKDLEAANGPLPKSHPANYVMVNMFDFDDPGLVVLPTHRMIRGINKDWLADLKTALSKLFEVQTWPFDDSRGEEEMNALIEAMLEARPTAHAFGFCGLEKDLLHMALLPHDQARKLHLVPQGSEAYQQLDVSILHSFILSELLGIDATMVDSEQYVSYTRNEMVAANAVREGHCQIAIFLNGTLPQEIRDVALAKDRMPQKSTYFYPKAPTGLVLNTLSQDVLQRS